MNFLGKCFGKPRQMPELDLSETLAFNALALEGAASLNDFGRVHFAIREGKEAASAMELLACLKAGLELSLRNDLDEGGEGCTLFRMTREGLISKVGGHGWSGDWKAVDEDLFPAMVEALAPHNRGGHWSTLGCISRSP